MLKTVVKCPFVTSWVLDAQNCGKMHVFEVVVRQCFCDAVVFLWWCGGVFVVVVWLIVAGLCVFSVFSLCFLSLCFSLIFQLSKAPHE